MNKAASQLRVFPVMLVARLTKLPEVSTIPLLTKYLEFL